MVAIIGVAAVFSTSREASTTTVRAAKLSRCWLTLRPCASRAFLRSVMAEALHLLTQLHCTLIPLVEFFSNCVQVIIFEFVVTQAWISFNTFASMTLHVATLRGCMVLGVIVAILHRASSG